MACLRPATPGFVVTLIATALLTVVVVSVPFIKTVYFLKAAIDYEGVSGNIIFGTLGYCVEQSGNTTCSRPSFGYQLDINDLVGNSLPIQIPSVVTKWITYFIFILHVGALALAAASAVFGLLAHVREMAMTCCSTWFSGLAAIVTLLAFIFDMVLFGVIKKRINDVGHAQLGTAVWLTLAAWVLLFSSSCFYALGTCCIRGRSYFGRRNPGYGDGGSDKNYAEEMRLDAVKAEADRKARQKQGEVGLPAFYETQPLTGRVEGEHVYLDGEHNQSKPDLSPHSPSKQKSSNFKGGYVPGPTGTRSMDDYYRSSNSPAPTDHPPQRPVREQSYSVPSTSASPPITYANPSGYGQYNNDSTSTPPPLSTSVPPGHHQQYNRNPTFDPYGPEYGHTAGGTSYHSAISHDQGPSSYAQSYGAMNDPYAAYPPQTPQHLAQTTYDPDPYMPFVSHTPMPRGITTDASHYYPPMPTSTSPPPIQQPQPLHGDRSYTLGGGGYGYGGDGYGGNQLPPLPEHAPTPPTGAGTSSYLTYGQQPRHQHLAPIDTNVVPEYIPGQSFQTSPVKGPMPGPNEAPPGYEPGALGADATANWGKK